VAHRELAERPQAVRGNAEIERALLLERGREGEEQRSYECEDLGQDPDSMTRQLI
jgi:hypothetical protein